MMDQSLRGSGRIALWWTDHQLRIHSYSTWLVRLFGGGAVGLEVGELLESANIEHPVITAHLRALGGMRSAFIHDLPDASWWIEINPTKDAHGVVTGCSGRAERVDVDAARRTAIVVDLDVSREAPLAAIAKVAALRALSVLPRARCFRPEEQRLVIVAPEPDDPAAVVTALRHLLSEQFFIDAVPYAVATNVRLHQASVRLTSRAEADRSGIRFVPRVRLSDGALVALDVHLGGIPFEEVFDVLTEWTGRGITPPRVCLPVELGHLRHRSFVEALMRSFAWSDLEAKSMEVEISDETVAELGEEEHGRLVELRERGVGIVLAGFGSSRVSLTQYGRLPLTAVKVSAELISNQSALEAVAVAARLLHVQAMASGVETLLDASAVAKAGFVEASGGLFVENAVPDGEISVVMNAGRPTFVL